MSSNDKLLVGLDIGARAIKVCEISPSKTGFNLINLHDGKLDDITVENGTIIDFGEIVDSITKIRETVLIDNFSIAVALKGPSTILRRVYAYTEKPEELEEIFRWIADQYLPIDPEEYSLDYAVLPKVDRYNHASVLVTGAKKETIADFVSLLESSKVDLKMVEPESLSLIRLYRALNLPKISSAIIHVGHIGSLMIFLRDGEFDFSKEISVGGAVIADELSDVFGVSQEDAERYRHRPLGESNATEIVNALEDIYKDQFIPYVEEACKLYEIRSGRKISVIYLSGGGATSYGLKETLMSVFLVNVDFLDPWKMVTYSEKYKSVVESDARYTFNVSLGLALYGLVY